MKTLFIFFAAAALSLGSCERRSVDSQVRSDGPTGTVDEQDPAKRGKNPADSIQNQNHTDSAEQSPSP